jgi:hypothetical protein
VVDQPPDPVVLMNIDYASLVLGIFLGVPLYGLLDAIVVPRYGRWLRIQHDRRR